MALELHNAGNLQRAAEPRRHRAPAPGRTQNAKPPAARRAPQPASPKAKTPGGNAVAIKLPDFVELQLATLVDEVPSGDEWFHEVKFDGYRALCRIDDGKVKFLTRNGLDWSGKFSSLVKAAAELPCRRALLDGEVVVLDDSGVSDFGALQDALSRKDASRLVYYVFDLLHLDGVDLTRLPLVERKQRLEGIIKSKGVADGSIRYSDHVPGHGAELFAKACESGIEGVVSKRAAASYTSGRSRAWLKTKCSQRQEFVIVGFTDPAGSRAGFGALLLGYHNPQKQLVYAGKVGTGFDNATLAGLRQRLQKFQIDKAPLAELPPPAERRGAHWVKPLLVGEVAFTGWTRDGRLRHPVFKGLREDKSPGEITREQPAPTAAALSPRGNAAAEDDKIAGIPLTHPDRMLYPEQQVSKRDLALYYESIGEWIMPHLKDRLVTLVRCPEKYDKECFYQRHANHGLDSSVRRVRVSEKGQPVEYIAVDTITGVIALVQAGVLEIHTWGSRCDRPDRPDRLTFDLDPDPDLPWSAVADAARLMQARLKDLGLGAFLKTTGGKGLHVVVPIARTLDWQEAKAFAKALADSMTADEPKKYLAVMSKARRQGKVFIDYLRNGWAATAVAAFSTRARNGAPVSAPLFWRELDSCRGDSFNLKNLPARLQQLKSDPWADWEKARRPVTQTMRKKLAA
jgi:bifunctional non-homologous end joining protein LigD